MTFELNGIRARAFCVALSALAAMGATSPAWADLPAFLNPGDTVAVPDFQPTAQFVDSKTVDFGSGAGPSGVLTELVVNNVEDNPFGPAALAFAFSLSLTSGDVADVVLPGYAGFQTAVKSCDVDVCALGTGTPPDFAFRSFSGDTITFFFEPAVDTKTAAFDVYTNATYYTDPPTIEIVDSAGDISFAAGFAPAAAPEPSTWTLSALGFAAAGLFRWRAGRRRRLAAPEPA